MREKLRPKSFRKVSEIKKVFTIIWKKGYSFSGFLGLRTRWFLKISFGIHSRNTVFAYYYI